MAISSDRTVSTAYRKYKGLDVINDAKYKECNSLNERKKLRVNSMHLLNIYGAYMELRSLC